MAQAVIRRHIVEEMPIGRCFVDQLKERLSGEQPKKELDALMKSLQKATGLTVREIAEIVGKSPSTVQYHLRKENQNA
jgi:DNA-binding transcriptional ArsR family regulator